MLVSEQIKELVFFKFIKNVWSIMLRSGDDDGFSIYLKHTLRNSSPWRRIEMEMHIYTHL